MIKQGIWVAVLAMAASATFAEVIVFGDDTAGVGWKNQGVADNVSNTQTATITENGLTFTLSITGSDKINTTSGDGTSFGINGGTTTKSDGVRLSSENAGDEWVEFSLSVSGPNAAQLQDISLSSIYAQYFGTGETIDINDGTTTVSISGSNDSAVQNLDYANELAAITALSLANVGGVGNGTWKLRLTATDDGTEAYTNFALNDVTINYTIPEPATLGLIGAMGGILIFIRRRFMV